MSLRNVDFDAAFRRLADRRIEEAMKEGKFDNLPGKGEDIVIDEAPDRRKRPHDVVGPSHHEAERLRAR